MPNLRRDQRLLLPILLISIGVSAPVILAQEKPAPAASTKHKSRKRSPVKAVPAPTAAIQPLQPQPQVALTRSQLPAVPPRVEYRDGQLAIAAENSTLGDILRAVHQQTGATVDMPANANERVVAHLGPGPARDVLATLLDGSNFNYVMLGSPTDSTVIQRLIVSAKSGSAVESPAQEPPAQAAQTRTPFGNNAPFKASQDESEESTDPDVQSEEQAEEQSTDEAAEGQTDNQQQPSTGEPAVKTPEQLLQELQRQQQQPQRPQAAPQGFPVPTGQVPEQNGPQQAQPQPQE